MTKSRIRRKPRTSQLLRWHRWCGLFALIFLLLASFSGTALLYKQALIRLIIVQEARLPAAYNPAQMAPQLNQIAAQIRHDSSSYLIKAPNSEEPYWTLTRDTDHHVQLLAVTSLEPYQNNLWLLRCLSFFRTMHTELFTGIVGEMLLLISGVLGLFLSISGVILWWPTKRSFRWRWIFPTTWSTAYLMHYHRHTGTLSVAMLLLIMLTGSIMLWQKLVRPILPPVAVTSMSSAMENAAAAQPADLFLTAQHYIPDGWPTYIRLPFGSNNIASFRYRLPDEWHPNGRTSVKIQTTSGDVVVSARSDNVSTAQNLVNQIYPLHSAYGMNAFYSVFVLCGGLALFWLAITGGLSYLRRRN